MLVGIKYLGIYYPICRPQAEPRYARHRSRTKPSQRLHVQCITNDDIVRTVCLLNRAFEEGVL